MDANRKIAYFSMEIGLDAALPTYSGGLGILAGDTIRAAADLKVPMVAMTLLYRKGYFYQRLDAQGHQSEEPVDWVVNDFLEETPPRVAISIEGRQVHLRAWKYAVTSSADYEVPIYFLDADLPENAEWDRRLTDQLYGGDAYYRLCQETILGIGGVRMLRALGYTGIERFHMNEGPRQPADAGTSRRAAGEGRDARRLPPRTSRRSAGCACSRPIRRWPPAMTSFLWTLPAGCSASTRP
jgi:starch phosphorylase